MLTIKNPVLNLEMTFRLSVSQQHLHISYTNGPSFMLVAWMVPSSCKRNGRSLSLMNATSAGGVDFVSAQER